MESRSVGFIDTKHAISDEADIKHLIQAFIDGLRTQDRAMLDIAIADDAVLDSYFVPHPTSKTEFIELAAKPTHAKYLQNLRYVAASITEAGTSATVEGLLEGRLPEDPAPTYHRCYRLRVERRTDRMIVTKGEYDTR